MTRTERRSGIDRIRILAGVLVVALFVILHALPFLSELIGAYW